MVLEVNKNDNPVDALSEAVSKQLEKLAESLVNGDTQALREYLGVMARFNRYSLNNQLLIALQKPEATQVAGYQVWKELGRQVKRGEQGIRILAPLIRKTKEDQDESPKVGGVAYAIAAEPLPVVFGFKSVSVFDVSQTEGEALPEYRRVGVSGQLAEGLLERVIKACPYAIRLEARPLNEYGMTDGEWIEINANHNPAEQLVTLFHEWAHCLLHFVPQNQRPPLQVRELEAEATAFVLASMLGVEARLGSAEYLTGYKTTPATLGAALKEVTRAVKTISEALEV